MAVGETDHMAKIMDFRLAVGDHVGSRWKWRRPPAIPTRGFDTAKLKDERVQKQYCERMAAVVTEDMTWTEVVPKIQEVAGEILGPRQNMGPCKIPTEAQKEIKKAKDETKMVFEKARECQNPEEAKQWLAQSRLKSKEHSQYSTAAVH